MYNMFIKKNIDSKKAQNLIRFVKSHFSLSIIQQILFSSSYPPTAEYTNLSPACPP